MFELHGRGRHADSEVPGCADRFSLLVASLYEAAEGAEAVAAHRTLDADDAIEILLAEEVVVAVEDDRHAGVDEHVVDRPGRPARAPLYKSVVAQLILSSPFERGHSGNLVLGAFNAVSAVRVGAADEAVNEDDLPPRPAAALPTFGLRSTSSTLIPHRAA